MEFSENIIPLNSIDGAAELNTTTLGNPFFFNVTYKTYVEDPDFDDNQLD